MSCNTCVGWIFGICVTWRAKTPRESVWKRLLHALSVLPNTKGEGDINLTLSVKKLGKMLASNVPRSDSLNICQISLWGLSHLYDYSDPENKTGTQVDIDRTIINIQCRTNFISTWTCVSNRL